MWKAVVAIGSTAEPRLNQQKIQRLQEEDRKHAAFQFRADEVMALAPSQEHLRQQHRDQAQAGMSQAQC